MNGIQIWEVNGTGEFDGICFAQCSTKKNALKAMHILEENGFEDMLEIKRNNLRLDQLVIGDEVVRLQEESETIKRKNKYVLIEVENQNINEPDTYDSYIEAFGEMKRRYENLMGEGDESSIHEFDACIQTSVYNIDWKIYKMEEEE